MSGAVTGLVLGAVDDVIGIVADQVDGADGWEVVTRALVALPIHRAKTREREDLRRARGPPAGIIEPKGQRPTPHDRRDHARDEREHFVGGVDEETYGAARPDCCGDVVPQRGRQLARRRVIDVEREREGIDGEVEHTVLPPDDAAFAPVAGRRALFDSNGRVALPDGDVVVDGAAADFVLVAPAPQVFDRGRQRALPHTRARGVAKPFEEVPQLHPRATAV